MSQYMRRASTVPDTPKTSVNVSCCQAKFTFTFTVPFLGGGRGGVVCVEFSKCV